MRGVGQKRSTVAALWVALVVVVALFGFPFVYLVLTSFKTPSDAIAIPPAVLPRAWSLQNYTAALQAPGVVASFVNSLSTALISTALSIGLGVPAAYGITRFASRAGRVFMSATLVTRMVPPVAIGIPIVAMANALGLRDTPTGLGLAHATISLPLSIWLLCSFFESVPGELEEAARVDGCGRLRALWSVIMPVVSGGVAVTAIFAFLASWNEFLFALLLTATRGQTTPIVIANFQTQFGLQWGPMTALACLYSVPVVVLTLFLQRRIVAGLTLGAVKG
ncbi:carbohydrate ABC transporter permease [Terrabacter sp. MAHUQ-38]|jgi:multiple sugar transport system permease protein|uniref:carbohydrate ABC transporter permease n=1 Tax=unclassified Terrabacter TaxID=2630222 RepID=UPI00165E17D6|nr:carbohydrate ABC transporter permease [Terrabacter sp. MAHUQ-38]